MSSGHPIKPEDLTEYHFLSDLKISNQALYTSFMVHKSNENRDGYVSDLWLIRTPQKKDFSPIPPRKLTSSGDVGVFCWLDDQSLLFSSKRADKEKDKERADSTDFYKIAVDGGEAEKVFSIPAIVSGIENLDDRRFVVCAEYDHRYPDLVGPDLEARAKALEARKKEQDYMVFEELPFWRNGKGYTDRKRNRLFLFDTAESTLKPLTPPLYEVEGWKVSPEHDRILYYGSCYEDKEGQFQSLQVLHLDSEETTTHIKDGRYRIDHAEFMGQDVLFLGTDCAHYGCNEDAVFYVADSNGCVFLMYGEDFSMGNSVLSDCRMGGGTDCKICGDSLMFIATNRFNAHLCRMTADGLTYLTKEEGVVDCFDSDGHICCFIGCRGARLQEIYALDLTDGNECRLTNFNEKPLEERRVSPPRPLFFVNKEGVEIDGWVLEPAHYDAQKKYPAILNIHGGPKTAYGPLFFHEMQVWAGCGYFVFFCNPRGGDGRGNAFADIRGRYGEEDYRDLMEFTDHVLDVYASIDRNRLGVTGGSYGGFMTNWIIGHTDRFAAAVSQRSIASWISMEGVSDIGLDFPGDQTGATTWDGFERLWHQSPLQYADRVKTPTLFIHSREDYRCPECEGIQMFSALKRFDVPARLVLFKEENHELSRSGQPKHRIRRLQEITDWFNRFLS